MTRLFVDLYTDTVIEENYDAELAGIHYHLYAHQGGVTLQLSGYSENQHLLLAKLLARLKTQQVTEAHFILFKKQLITYWQNNEKSKSISQLFANLSAVMQPNNPTSNTLAEVLSHITFSQYQSFSQQVFKQVTLEVLIHGNWLPEHADKLCTTIESVFHEQVHDKYRIQCPIIDINDKQTLLIPLALPEHDHACVIYNAMPVKDPITVALTIMTSHILSPLFFQKMRTEKQYGYLVGVGYVPINRYPGIAFYIQSPHCDAYSLANAMDEFIDNSMSMLEDIQIQEWQHLQQGLAGQLQEKDHNLRIKSQRFWAAICNKDDEFTDKDKLLKAMLSLTLAQVKSFVSERLVIASQPDRFILYSQSDELAQSLKPSGLEVTDIEHFVASSTQKF
jgi:secreted Zn-dependent insulinase-like peptidase